LHAVTPMLPRVGTLAFNISNTLHTNSPIVYLGNVGRTGCTGGSQRFYAFITPGGCCRLHFCVFFFFFGVVPSTRFQKRARWSESANGYRPLPITVSLSDWRAIRLCGHAFLLRLCIVRSSGVAPPPPIPPSSMLQTCSLVIREATHHASV
jgi:hypothetical protein